MCLLLQQLGGFGAFSRMFALFLSRLDQQQRVSRAPLLCCPLGQAMKSARDNKTVQRLWNSIPGFASPTPQPCNLLSLAVTSGISRQWGMGWGRNWSQKFWSKTCFAQWETHIEVGSETCVKEPFKGLLSARTQHCVPDSKVQATSHPPQEDTKFTSL